MNHESAQTINSLRREMYLKSGISEEVYDFCEPICESLRDRFEMIDQIFQLGRRIIFNQIIIHKPLRGEPVSDLTLKSGVIFELQLADGLCAEIRRILDP